MFASANLPTLGLPTIGRKRAEVLFARAVTVRPSTPLGKRTDEQTIVRYFVSGLFADATGCSFVHISSKTKTEVHTFTKSAHAKTNAALILISDALPFGRL